MSKAVMLSAPVLLIAIVAYLLLFLPSSPSPDISPPKDFIITNVFVSKVELIKPETFPIQINALVKGEIPDSCAQIDQIRSSRDGNSFIFNITASKPSDAVCNQVLTEFEQFIPIDSIGLSAGTYDVVVNGAVNSFTLDQDNFLN